MTHKEMMEDIKRNHEVQRQLYSELHAASCRLRGEIESADPKMTGIRPLKQSNERGKP